MSHRPPSPSRTATAAAAPHPTRTDDLAWLSWLRVAAIAAVVLIHTAGLTAIAPDARTTAQGQLGIVLDFSSRWSVPAFVMVSGALLLDPARYRGAGDFLRRRAGRLVPAVVAWNLVYLAYALAATDKIDSPRTAAELILTGRLWTALYFFWIVLGLAVVTPVLAPWIAVASRRAVLLAGLAAAMLPALNIVTVPLRHPGTTWDTDVSWVETPWTWWIPYLGFYLLGYALRDVVLRRSALVLAAAAAVAGSVLLSWQWGKTDGLDGLIEHWVPAEAYYSPTLVVITVSVFLVSRALVRPGGLLTSLCRPASTLAGRRLGDATLGVYGVHLLVLEAMFAVPVLGGDAAAGSVPQLIARCVFVLVVAYVISLVAARIPYVRKVF